MYEIERTNSFKKAFKRCVKRGMDIKAFETVIDILSTTGKLPSQYKPHKLNSKLKFAWECHIEPDLFLVWQQNDQKLILILINIGSHSDIFG